MDRLQGHYPDDHEAAIFHALALGAARVGNNEAARIDLQQLASIRDVLIREDNKYWADQVDIQREIAAASITLADGKPGDALQQMASAADHEDKTDKHNVTPGVILPARELLGDMLLQLKQPRQAMTEFEAVLRTAPNRFNAFAGAARAAKLSGQNETAKAYYSKLLAICGRADGDRPDLRDAQSLWARK